MAIHTTDTDVEVYILGDIPSYIIEVYVPGDQKYSLTEDRLSTTAIRRQLDKEHGISKIADVTMTLKNEDNQYSRLNPDSIFYGKQYIKDWVRITSGWGSTWSNEPAVQFQGRIKHLSDASSWTANMIIYDALQDMKDTAITGNESLTIDNDVVDGMNPIDILEYLFDDYFQLTWFNMDTLEDTESLFDATSKAAARAVTEGTIIGDTTWPVGSKFLDMATDLMKQIGGFLYSGKDGKVNVYVYAPSQERSSARGLYSFVGDVTVKEPEIILSSNGADLDAIVNNVSWKYGQSQVSHSSEQDTASVNKHGRKTLELTTKWEIINTYDLDIVASRLLGRFAEPISTYDAKISWLRNGEGLAMDLGNIVDITDPALFATDEYVEVHRLQTNLDQQMTQAVLYDASALQGKFWWFSSEIDEGDGLGITGGNFDVNWLERFLFFSNNDLDNKPQFDQEGNSNGVVESTIAPIDDWGNGVESSFIFW